MRQHGHCRNRLLQTLVPRSVRPNAEGMPAPYRRPRDIARAGPVSKLADYEGARRDRLDGTRFCRERTARKAPLRASGRGLSNHSRRRHQLPSGAPDQEYVAFAESA